MNSNSEYGGGGVLGVSESPAFGSVGALAIGKVLGEQEHLALLAPWEHLALLAPWEHLAKYLTLAQQ